MLVDVESSRAVDALPDREPDAFAAWLTVHPRAEIACREHATADTKAIKETTPDALEIADRWHLLQNLGAAVENTVINTAPSCGKLSGRRPLCLWRRPSRSPS